MAGIAHLASKFNYTFPTPAFLSLDPVAIDISTQKIRLLKLKCDKHGFVPVIYKEIEMDRRYNIVGIANQKDTNSSAAQSLVNILKSLKKEFKLHYVTVSLPELKTYIFRIKLPKEAGIDISSSVKYSLEENVPLSPEEVVFDYSIVNEKTKKPKDDFDVVVNVFPKSVISIYSRIFRAAGLFPISFQSESTALAAAAVTAGDLEPYLLIRLLEDRVSVAIVEQNVVQYASSIPVRANDILKGDQKFGVGVGATTDGAAAGGASAAGVGAGVGAAAELKESLNKLLVFWFTNKDYDSAHKKIETALLIGDHATEPVIQEFLERHLRINVEVANVWTNCFNLDDYIPEIKQKDSLNYAVAIGLAIKSMQRD